MKAAFYDQLGAARDVLQLGDVEEPQPQPGEVRVRVCWSGINPSDVKSRAGLRGRSMDFPRIIPHSDGMGVIDHVGPGVESGRVGERVWLMNAAWGRPSGTAAEWCCVPASMAVPLPDNVDDWFGACLGIPAMTALHAVLLDGGVAGRTVLVAGGAGSVGHYAVQFASQLGAAHVIATVGSGADAAIASAAGADTVVNRRTEPVVDTVMSVTGGRGADRVIEVDFANNIGMDVDLLRLGGECVAYGSTPRPAELPFPKLLAKNVQLKFFMVYHLPGNDRQQAVDVLTRLLQRGALAHRVGVRLPLSEIVSAHELVERGGTPGKVLLRIR